MIFVLAHNCVNTFTLKYKYFFLLAPHLWYCSQEKFSPRFISALFNLWFVGEFKTEPIELHSKNYVTKLEIGRI